MEGPRTVGGHAEGSKRAPLHQHRNRTHRVSPTTKNALTGHVIHGGFGATPNPASYVRGTVQQHVLLWLRFSALRDWVPW